MYRRLLRGAVLTVATAAAIFLVMKFAPAVRERDMAYANCRQAMASTCLLDLGVAEALGSRKVPAYMREVGQLAAIGRIEDAAAIERRIQEKRAPTPEEAVRLTNRSMASQRLTAAIGRGESLADAIDAIPGTDGGTLWISALDLLGHHPFGLALEDPVPPDAATRDIVAEIAEAIVRIAAGEAERARQSDLVYAAELWAELGRREDAMRVLSQLPGTGHDAPLGEDLTRLIGPEFALGLYPPTEAQRRGMLLRAAAVTDDPAMATDYVDEAFEMAAGETPWPDYSAMEMAAVTAARAGLRDRALILARRMETLAASGKRLFPAFPHLSAARALMAAGAGEAEVRQSVDNAVAEFPADGQVVGFGLVSGVMQWGRSGLDAQARREVATLRARLGDPAAAIRMMDGISDPVFAWGDVMTPDIPVASYAPMLAAAQKAMSDDEFAYVSALMAANILRFGGTEDHRAWALDTAQQILGRDGVSGLRATRTYGMLAEVGFRTGDWQIETEALERMGLAALASGSATDLLSAGLVWHDYEQRAAR